MKTIFETAIKDEKAESIADIYNITDSTIESTVNYLIDLINDDSIDAVYDLLNALNENQKRTVALSLVLNLSDTVVIVLFKSILGDKNTKEENITISNLVETIVSSKYCNYHIASLLNSLLNGIAVTNIAGELIAEFANQEK